MAFDSENKRASAMAETDGFPVPDGAITSLADRLHLLGLYSATILVDISPVDIILFIQYIARERTFTQYITKANSRIQYITREKTFAQEG